MPTKRSSSRSSAPRRRKRRSKADKQAMEQMLTLLRTDADIRSRKARRTRAAIRARRYENVLKLGVAIERLVEDLK